MRSLKIIDKEIGKLSDTVATLTQKKEKALADAAESKSTREQLSLQALADGDPDAVSRLEGARRTQREVEMVVEDLDSAIVEANRKIQILESERDETFRNGCWNELLKIGAEAVSEAEKLEKMFIELGTALSEHDKKLHRMMDLSAKSGRPKTFIFKLAHARRAMEGLFHKDFPAEYPTRYKEFEMGYAQFMRSRVERVGNVNEPEIEEKEIA